MAKVIFLIPTSLLVFAVLTQGAHIGDSCSEDKECDSYTNNNFVCRNQQTCDCKKGFFPVNSKDSCQAAVNTVCTTQDDCTSLPNSECNQNICVCRPDFVSSYDNRECLPRTSFIGGPCSVAEQCQMSFGQQSMCDADICRCINGYHISNDFKCIKNCDLSDSCTRDDDCYNEETKHNVLRCTDGKCSCRDGYVLDPEYGRTCISSGNILAASILTLVAWGTMWFLA